MLQKHSKELAAVRMKNIDLKTLVENHQKRQEERRLAAEKGKAAGDYQPLRALERKALIQCCCCRLSTSTRAR